MKKLSSILTAGVMGAIMAISFTGCGNPPQPYNYKMNNQHKDISDYEKQQLLNIVIDRNSRLKYKTSNGCVMLDNQWYKEGWSYKYKNKFKHCFKINNLTISRIDNSSCSRDHGRSYGKCNYIGNGFDNYIKFINDLQNNVLSSELQTEISNYQKFISLYDKADAVRKEKITQVKTSLIDNTKVLPKSVFEQMNKFNLSTNRVTKKIDLYKSYVAPQNGKSLIDQFGRSILGDSISENFDKVFQDESSLAHEFKISSSTTKNAINRYKVNYKQNSYSDSYDKFPSNITYEIDKVYFNYLPIKFITSDDNIDVEVKNNPLGSYDSIEYIKVYNKTKEFIEIDTIAGYYGENVTDNIINIKDMKRVKISPMSYKIFKTGYSYEYRINDYPSRSNRLLLVNDRNQKVNYGFSIGYKMINQNIIKNLYKVNQYSIKDFK